MKSGCDAKMFIKNSTKETLLAESFEECKTWWEQTKGMMFRKRVVPLVFYFGREKTIRLHSWFCPGEMDLVFLDENWEVVELHSDWPQRRSYVSEQKAMFLLELPAGTIANSKTEVGDVVQIVK